MPRYDYSCAKCGVFEAYQYINSEPLKHCPVCFGEVRKLISTPALLNTGTRLEAVKRSKDIINYVDKSGKHGTHPDMKQAMCDYGKISRDAKLVKAPVVLDK